MYIVRMIGTKRRNRFQPNLAVELVLMFLCSYVLVSFYVGLKEYESKAFEPFPKV